PVAVVGSIMDADHAEQILRENKADMIVMVRALLADPDWPMKVIDEDNFYLVQGLASSWY
ncbi:MAG: hypothetical protein QW707_04875, partial [Candidatus Bathyarchaeia archaeon]